MKIETCNDCLYYDSCPHTGLCEHYYNASMDDELAMEYVEELRREHADLYRVYIGEYQD